MKGKATDVNPNRSQHPGSGNAGPESTASLKSGLAARERMSNPHGSLGMDEGKGGRPNGWKGEKVKAPNGKTYTFT